VLSQGIHEGLPFIFWNNILRLVVGMEALVFHIGFIEYITAIGIVLFAMTLWRTFLQLL
jgi:hypothetical protein